MLSARRIMTVAVVSALLSLGAIVPAAAAQAPDPDDVTDGLLEQPVSTLVGAPLGIPLAF
ncbi:MULTISPECIES: hypothetical protein [unclassified Streptomyces]|uniref:hypothetical protein n=1 Tax=unclassified Streptomyces TaxID=2593676 RepID=UPI004041EF55